MPNFLAGNIRGKRSTVDATWVTMPEINPAANNHVPRKMYEFLDMPGKPIMSIDESTFNFSAVSYSFNGGVDWSQTSVVTGNNLRFRALAYGAGKVVMVGYDATPNPDEALIYTSPDADGPWTERTIPAGIEFLADVIRAGSKFVALGHDGTDIIILESSDGITWTKRIVGTLNFMTYGSLAYDGTYVYVGAGATSQMEVYRSTNLTSWTDVSPGGAINSGSLIFVLPVSKRLFACYTTSPATTNGLAYSDNNGDTWTVMTGTELIKTITKVALTPYDSVFMTGTTVDFELTGDGGVTFTDKAEPDTHTRWGLSWVRGRFMLAALNTQSPLVDRVWAKMDFY